MVISDRLFKIYTEMESGDQQEKECYICGAPIKLPHYNLHLLRC